MTTQSQSEVTLSIRLIRSFEHRNLRFFPLQAVDLSWTTEQLMTVINERITTSTSLPPPFRKFQFDTLKIEHQAHGAKTSDPVMNCENDIELILKPGQALSQSNVRHETEVAFFKLSDYQACLKLKED
jgi:hypothetical protein